HGGGSAMYLDNGTKLLKAQNNIAYYTGCWTFLNFGSGSNYLINNYADNITPYDRGDPPSTITGMAVYNPLSPTSKQKEILDKAGLQDEYKDLRKHTRGYQVPVQGVLHDLFETNTEINVIENNPVTASDGKDAKSVSDGNIQSAWNPMFDWENGLWFKVDLGKTYTLTRWEMYLEQAIPRYIDNPDNYYNLLEFSLEVSQDGEKWETVDRVHRNRLAIANRPLDSVRARFVKVNIHSSDFARSSKVLLRECQIFGHE
ncbi:MAG TPA: discoidin domain-containing protein, partial [Clostridia bacterium]|nr:discoidin domain-containing protein [Clostridia bacterium]